jgi:SAM-dependent methyltransferase
VFDFFVLITLSVRSTKTSLPCDYVALIVHQARGESEQMISELIHDAGTTADAPAFRGAQAARYLSGGDNAFREVEGRRRSYDRKAAQVVAALRASMPNDEDAAVEVGCGGGILTQRVASSVPDRRIVGTDFSPVMLDQARKKCAAHDRVEFRVHDIYQPFTKKAEFAFGFGCDILHHLDDPAGALGNLREALRPGGRMLFLESNPRNPVIWLRVRNRPEEQRVFLNSESALTRWACEAGFVDVEVTLLPFHLPNGPRALAPCLNYLEDRMFHRLPPFRRRAAMFALRGTRGD